MKGLDALTVEMHSPNPNYIYIKTGFGLSLSIGITEYTSPRPVLAHEWLSPCCFGFVRPIHGWEITNRVVPNATMYDVVCGQCSQLLPVAYREHPMDGLMEVARLQLDPILATLAVNGLLDLLERAMANRTSTAVGVANGEHSLVAP